ncbi:uncharacterized homolog isoform X1 [Symphalangus syndactylus]|uniref:uncharacterized homolog isoform X1 n=1 Tax=Symphalangus syndactylus TaxID=9590 RepID=UPI002441EAD1|nr:uncharacterized LOC128031832 homolog isoform X1 [Symphalangus syndactylus]
MQNDTSGLENHLPAHHCIGEDGEKLFAGILILAFVFRWNIRCTFMAILSVRADFCQAQHSVFADK